jgi:hypothetical protein
MQNTSFAFSLMPILPITAQITVRGARCQGEKEGGNGFLCGLLDSVVEILLYKEEENAATDARVGDVESWEMGTADVKVEEIDDSAEEETVNEVADDTGEKERLNEGGEAE